MTASKISAVVDAIDKLYDAGDLSFREMAFRLGLDPKKDFRGADLRGIDLSYEDLTEFDFRGADLSGANLYKAVFRISSLAGAKLTQAQVPDVAWLRPRWSAFAPSKSWESLPSQDAMSFGMLAQREYLYEITKRRNTVALIAPVRWLPHANFFLLITKDAAGNTRQLFFLQSGHLVWSLGGKVEEDKLWRRTEELSIDAENVVEYLALYLYIYNQLILFTPRGFEDIQIFSNSKRSHDEQGIEKYLDALTTEPRVSRDADGFKVECIALGAGVAHPVFATISSAGRVRFDSKPIIASDAPIMIISPHEDPDTLFADWASTR
jgi:hypothetical protein